MNINDPAARRSRRSAPSKEALALVAEATRDYGTPAERQARTERAREQAAWAQITAAGAALAPRGRGQ